MEIFQRTKESEYLGMDTQIFIVLFVAARAMR
jgi:hypothetical protein